MVENGIFERPFQFGKNSISSDNYISAAGEGSSTGNIWSINTKEYQKLNIGNETPLPIENYNELRIFILDLKSYLQKMNDIPKPDIVPMPNNVFKHFKKVYDNIQEDFFERSFDYYDYGEDYNQEATYEWGINKNEPVTKRTLITETLIYPAPKLNLRSNDAKILFQMHSHPFKEEKDDHFTYYPDVGIPSGFPPIYFKNLDDSIIKYTFLNFSALNEIQTKFNELNEIVKVKTGTDKYKDHVPENLYPPGYKDMLNQIIDKQAQYHHKLSCFKEKLNDKVKYVGDLRNTRPREFSHNKDKVFAVMGTLYLTFYGNGVPFAVYDLKNNGNHFARYIQYTSYYSDGMPPMKLFMNKDYSGLFITYPEEEYWDKTLDDVINEEDKCEQSKK